MGANDSTFVTVSNFTLIYKVRILCYYIKKIFAPDFQGELSDQNTIALEADGVGSRDASVKDDVEAISIGRLWYCRSINSDDVIAVNFCGKLSSFAGMDNQLTLDKMKIDFYLIN